MGAVANKQQLANLLSVSATTLNIWMQRYGDDFPVLERGSHGREFKFDPVAVSDFLRARQDEQKTAKAQKDEALAQLRLPFNLPGVEPPPVGSSSKEELLAWQVRKLKREEAERSGQLVDAAEIGDLFKATLSMIARDVQSVIRNVAREHQWPEAVLRTVERRLADQQRTTVATLKTRMMKIGVAREATEQATADAAE